MTFIPLLITSEFEPLKVSTQVDVGDSAVNHALTVVAQEVAGLLQQADLNQRNCNNDKTITIRAIEPECRQIIQLELLTGRELEVLKLMVDSNSAIARNLCISISTVKTHVRNILRKLYCSDSWR